MMGYAGPDPTDTMDEELLAIFSRFSGAEAALRDTIGGVDGEEAAASHPLHQQWIETCLQVAALPAITAKGLRAKAAMLLTVLAVLAPPTQEQDLHEILAESLARDLLGTPRG
jgi:hypothetical protein